MLKINLKRKNFFFIYQNLTFIFVIFFSSSTFSSEVLDYFYCDNDTDAVSCSNSCKKQGTIRFIITDKSATNLLMQSNILNTPLKSTLLNNCKITDTKNWYCSEMYSDVEQFSARGYKVFQMINGNYSEQYNYLQINNKSDGNSVNKWIETFGCAKK